MVLVVLKDPACPEQARKRLYSVVLMSRLLMNQAPRVDFAFLLDEVEPEVKKSKAKVEAEVSVLNDKKKKVIEILDEGLAIELLWLAHSLRRANSHHHLPLRRN